MIGKLRKLKVFLISLKGTTLGMHMRIYVLWSPNPERGFSIKFYMSALALPTSVPFYYNMIWESFLPSKVSFFLWELWWNRVSMIDNLIRRGIIIPNHCSVQSGWENCWSSLFSLPRVVVVWDFCLLRLSIVQVQPKSVRQLIDSQRGQSNYHLGTLG